MNNDTDNRFGHINSATQKAQLVHNTVAQQLSSRLFRGDKFPPLRRVQFFRQTQWNKHEHTHKDTAIPNLYLSAAVLWPAGRLRIV